MSTQNKNQQASIAVTGYGMVTALGIGVDTNWEGLMQGKSGIKTISRFNPEGLRTTIAAVTDFDEVVGAENIQSQRIYNLANLVIKEALDSGKLILAQLHRFQLFCAIPPLDFTIIEYNFNDDIRLIHPKYHLSSTKRGGGNYTLDKYNLSKYKLYLSEILS